ncbi:MAG: flagellar protein [Lachnospiraceae bacterium]|nr:flagellar protein [Lachnospiraceae bacterium]
MDINSGRFLSIEQLQDQYLSPNKTNNTQKTSEGLSFKDILTQKSGVGEEVKFSKHAANRLSSRNIELTDEQLGRLNEGTLKAQSKGIKESLIMVDSLAFIVNIPSNTVVTAMNQEETQDNIFTNIDGAVII